jgi:hypothetical protein
MRQASIDRPAEAMKLAKAIIAIPRGEVASAIRKMVLQRKLSHAVAAIDDLIINHPEHKELGVKALDRFGLWWDSDR